MAKIGEINYLKNIPAEAVVSAVEKPFSEPHRARYLAEMAAVFALLPPPPARLLDLGCGTGWTSIFFARSGYDVVGVDICPDMVFHADRMRLRAGLDNLHFLVADYEELTFAGAFDAAVFYDSLHHAVDERLALRAAWRALRPGGVCVTSEPGEGHHLAPAAAEAVVRYNVTEKDMPPRKIIALGREVGFRRFAVFPHSWDNYVVDYGDRTAYAEDEFAAKGWVKRLAHWLVRRALRMDRRAYEAYVPRFRARADRLTDFHTSGGIVCLTR
jgi:SAM-dependent methyltransferase